MRKKNRTAKNVKHSSEKLNHEISAASKNELNRLKHELESRVMSENGAVDIITKMHNSDILTIEHEHEAFQNALKYWCKLVNQNYLDTCDSEAELNSGSSANK